MVDRDIWLAEAATENGFAEAYLVGDVNLDGKVDAPDLNFLGLNWQDGDTARWSQANFDGIGGTGTEDLNALALQWQNSIASLAPSVVVPEPSSFACALISGCLFLWAGRKRYQ